MGQLPRHAPAAKAAIHFAIGQECWSQTYRMEDDIIPALQRADQATGQMATGIALQIRTWRHRLLVGSHDRLSCP
jgi:hypothetical protein